MTRKANLPTTWTEADWQDLHEAIEAVRAKIAARHADPPEAGLLPCPKCRCNDPISEEHAIIEGWTVYCRFGACGLSVWGPNQRVAEERWNTRV